MRSILTASASALFLSSSLLHAKVEVIVGHEDADMGFHLGAVPAPAIDDAAQKATFKVVEGTAANTTDVLTDGKVPTGDDDPKNNFFFSDADNGGRLVMDLGDVISVKAVDTYSWHNGGRGPQLYRLWASDGKAEGFNAEPKKDVKPDTAGWKMIATVDTRPKTGHAGGQYAVEVTDKDQPLGDFRYFMFEVLKTSETERFSNTFFSEIDVIDAKKPEVKRIESTVPISKTYTSKDKKYTYVIISTQAPELTQRAEKEVLPVIEEWYPKIASLIPSKGYNPPTKVTFEFKDNLGGTPAYAAGNRISLNHQWFAKPDNKEGVGAVVHEMVHVVQGYGRGGQHVPGWVTEGIPDYIRWFLYEPEMHGADIGPDRADKVNNDGNYRISANFINWVVKNKDKDLIVKLNTVGREGTYNEDLWKTWTGKTLQELNADWKADLKKGAGVTKK